MKNSFECIVVSILFILFSAALPAQEIFVKASVIGGENFVTGFVDPLPVESLFSEQLSEKGYQVHTTSNAPEVVTEKPLHLDLLVYRFPLAPPSVQLVLRKESRIIYQSKAQPVFFIEEQMVAERLAKRLGRKFPSPAELDEATAFAPQSEEETLQIVRELLNSRQGPFSKRYQLEMDIPAGIEFGYSIPLESWLAGLVSFNGFRKKIADATAEVELVIDPLGYTTIRQVSLPDNVNPRHLRKFYSIAEGLPIWINRTGETQVVQLRLSSVQMGDS